MSGSTFDPARCEIDPAKIIKYLLDLSSADGAGKARFFISRGFSLESWELLADALKKHAASNPASVAGSNPWGTKYEIEGLIDTPNGKTAFVRAIWQVEGDNPPRLVTAYPANAE
jgi:hypothetical protein